RLHWDRDRFESRLAQFRSEKEGPFARTLEQGVAFNSLSSLQSQEIVRPKAVKIEISSGTTRPVAGHPGFAAVGIVNPHAKVRASAFEFPGHRKPAGPGA